MAKRTVVDESPWIFVFGSNLRGRHGKGGAKFAAEFKGAVEGVGEGLSGLSYAIPTKDHAINTLPFEVVSESVKRFLEFAKEHSELQFQVSKVGCGLAGLDETMMMELFADASENCMLPGVWRRKLGMPCRQSIIIAGSRDFSSQTLMDSKMDRIISLMDNPVIISGGARGADTMGEDYAKNRGLDCEVYPARWKSTQRKRAGFIRNTLMAWRSTHLVAFWDGVSNGTSNMIETAKGEGLETRTIVFGPAKRNNPSPGKM